MSWFRIPPIVLAYAFAGSAHTGRLPATGAMRVNATQAIGDALNDAPLR